ncbi:MAG: C13 family peptidase [Acidobacteriota bacterium]
MTLRVFRTTALLTMLLAFAAPVAAQTVHLIVVVGLAGDPEHAELFQRWASTLVDGATDRLGVARDHVVYLTDQPDRDAKRATGKSTKAEIEAAFGKVAGTAKRDDVVFVVLIGHGTYSGKLAKFNLPGPDMGPADFEPLLKKLPAEHIVFVNTASASGPFLEELSGPGRTIVTAARTGAEQFATLFGGQFIDAFMSDAADADKNRRISVLEAFDAAKLGVARTYEQEGIMLTEHALLDDSGDKQGTQTPKADGKNGRVASMLSLGTVASAEAMPADPALRALYDERRDLERRVEGLKLLKTGMEPARYASELEKLLIELSLKSKQIKDLEAKR